MTLSEFVQKWLGKRTDYDHVYSYQCVDLILQYLADCYGITSGVWGNAIDYWTQPSPRLLEEFDKVTGPQQAGDIVIYNGTSTNPYGHIMIAVDGSTILEQNGNSGNGDGINGNEIRLRPVNTSRIAGILRPKKGNDMTKEQAAELALFIRLLAFESVDEANSHSDDDVRHILADPGYAGAIAKAVYRGEWQVPAWKAGHYDEVAARVVERDKTISDQQKQIESLKAQVGDNSKWETFKALLRELIK